MLPISYIKNQLQWIGCFKVEVLRKYLWSPDFNCSFCSDSYWLMDWEDFDTSIPFGVIDNKILILWGIDFHKLPETQKIHFKEYKIKLSDWLKKIETTDFYQAQIEVIFTEPILEVRIYQNYDILNIIWKEKFGYELFKNTTQNIDEIFELCIKYKNIILWSFDNFRSFITDWNILILEWLNIEWLKKHSKNLKIEVKNEYGSNIILKNLINKLNLPLMDSFKLLMNIRNYVDHRTNKKKEKLYLELCNQIWCNKDDYINLYYFLIKKIYDDIKLLIIELKKLNKK